MTTPPTDLAPPAGIEDLEIELLLEGIWRRYGYDFRDYDRAFMRRRVQSRLRGERLDTASQLLERVLREPAALERFLDADEPVAESFFRPARMWQALRRKALPALRTYPSVRAWGTGCTEGDLYSLLLVFREELARTFTLYATDLHDRRIRRTDWGAFPPSLTARLSKSFASAGGKRSLSHYLGGAAGKAVLPPNLLDRVVFGRHNPATDASFNEFHLILARRAMAGLGEALRARLHRLMHQSLVRLGFLFLGHGESLAGSPHADRYRTVDRAAGLYQKMAE